MRLSVTATVLSLCAVFAAASPVSQPITFNSNEVYIAGITYAGTGCPAGSVAVSALQGWTGIELGFDDGDICPRLPRPYPPFPPRFETRNCNINFRLHYPPGYSFTLFKTEYIGHVDLDSKVVATQESTYWFAGFPAPSSATSKTVWTGPISQNYDISNTILEAAYVWSPCGASTTLNVNTRVSVSNSANPQGQGSICLDKIKEKVQTIVGIQWKKCT